MMKKIIALGLSLLMLLSVCLTGCSEKTNEEAVEDISKKASKSAMTLSLYLMSENSVEKCQDCIDHDAGTGAKTCVDAKKQPCTYRLVSDAVNRITESKYKTRLVLHYYTEAEYYQKLDESFAAREAAKQAGQLGNTVIEEETEEDETFVNELGQIEIKYPTIAGYQVDLFFLGGEANFQKYKNRNLLASLDSNLSDVSKKLNQYIFPELLSGIKMLGGGSTYAIPNNRAIGEYTFLLLNKQALNDTYRRNDGGITTFDSYKSLTVQECKSFLDDVHRYQTEEFYPIYKDEDISTFDIAKANVQFMGVDANGKLSNDFSILGGYYDKTSTYGTPWVGYENLLNNTDFVNNLRTLKTYETEGYYYDEATDAGKKFAVGYVKGGAELVEQYSDEYEIVVIENPTLDAETVYESMFAVCANTTSLSRSMQILTFLNTNEEFRNLILYGIEGEHYRVIDTDVKKTGTDDTYQKAERLNNKYLMDPIKTGNVFISYPLQEVGQPDILPSIYDWGIKQNQDMRVSLIMGFSTTGAYLNNEQLQQIRALSEEIWADYEVATNFEIFLGSAILKCTELNSIIKKHVAPHGDQACDGSCDGSLRCLYDSWLKQAGLAE